MLGAVAALFAFADVGAVVDRVTGERMPASLASLELSRQIERVASAAPLLLASQTKSRQEDAAREIRTDLGQLDGLLADVRRGSPDPRLLSGIDDGSERNPAQFAGVGKARHRSARARCEAR